MRTGQRLRGVTATAIALLALCFAAISPAMAQKHGGTLRLQELDSPPSASLLEESTITVATPFSGIYNNLVKFNSATVHESIDSIVHAPTMQTTNAPSDQSVAGSMTTGYPSH